MELEDVMSSPRDNEADHDDRPTTQEDEDPPLQSPEPQQTDRHLATEQ